MENPLEEIDGVIKTLCQGTPASQRRTIDTYFLPDASFVHPLCSVHSRRPITVPSLFPGFAGGSTRPWLTFCTRDAVAAIYRWYRFMSPDTVVYIDSKAWDPRAQVLYVTIRQRFAIWFVPFYSANVKLVCELHLRRQRPTSPSVQTIADGQKSQAGGSSSRSSGGGGSNARQGPARYYIAKQEDHYQVNEVLRFILPVFGPVIWFIIQQMASLSCILLALPIFLVDRTFGDKEHV